MTERVAICITTLKRPPGLRRTLVELNKLTFSGPEPQITIVVIDNDSAGSSRATFEEMQPLMRWPMRYAIEPQRGIPFARNAAVRTAGPEMDFCCLIDDDEVPEPQWLDELLRVQRDSNADVVASPVHPRFVEPPPDWIVRGQFFEPRRHQTGEVLNYAFGGSVLWRASLNHEKGFWFPERYGLMGCDDSEIFPRIHRAGHKIVWSQEATVHEYVPPERANLRWMLQRMYRVGNSSVFVAQDLDGATIKTKAILLAKGGAWLVIGSSQWLYGLLAGKHMRVRGVRHLAYGAGIFAGLLGGRYEEYRATHEKK
jgi:succinoglycan biosynthesis protein ExoM